MYRCPTFLKETLDAMSGYEVFLAVLGCGFVNTLLLWFDKLDIQNYQLITMGTVGAWIVAKSVNQIAEVNATARASVAAAATPTGVR